MDDINSRDEACIQEVWSGLVKTPRTLNPKWFYDTRGSALFEAITRQPEYYLTRCELDILERHAKAIGEWIGPAALLAELGAGNGEKAVRLLSVLADPAAYVPIDISESSLEAAVQGIRRVMPHIRVEAMCVDFTNGFAWPAELSAPSRCLVFFGSTIGNMEPGDAAHWLSRLCQASLRPGDKMLLGVDLKKDPALLNAAYNDAQGVTAAFNLNALRHLNNELGTDFDLGGFRHQAFYNPERGRVEMHVQALRQQTVSLGQRRLTLSPGERIHTESSYKYTVAEFRDLTASAGFRTDAVWVDAQGWFSLHGLSVG